MARNRNCHERSPTHALVEPLEGRVLLASQELVLNGSFSQGAQSWSRTGDFYAGTTLSNYYSSPGYAAGGVSTTGTPKNNASGTISQAFSIPVNATSVTASWRRWITTTETTTSTAYDKLYVELVNTSGNVIATLRTFSNLSKTSGYTSDSVSLTNYRGQTVRLRFRATSDSSLPTTMRIDNVSVVAVIPDSPSAPSSPSGLVASAVSASQINLSWNDNSSNETGFKIERKTGSSGSWSQIATVGSSVTSFQSTGLSAGTTYVFRVRAYNATGNSGYSNESSATTTASNSGPQQPSGILQRPSVHHQSRGTTTASLIVLHTVVLSGQPGSFENNVTYLQSNSAGVSAHYVVGPDGAIAQLVQLDRAAIHAESWNNRSIGIEIVASASDPDAWTRDSRLLGRLADLVAWLCHTGGIPVAHAPGAASSANGYTFTGTGIVGHYQVSTSGKTDPGPYFPWNSFISSVQSRFGFATLQRNATIAGLSGAHRSERWFKITVPSGASNLRFEMWGGSGDADMYVKYGSAPTIHSWDYRPYLDGNNESVVPSVTTSGTWYVMLRGYSSYSGVSLKVSYTV